MKRILVLTDFSEAALNAASYVAQMSRDLKAARILLYHSSNLDSTEMVMLADSVVLVPKTDIDTRRDTVQKLQALKSKLQTIADDDTAVEIVNNDLPLLSGIREILSRENIDLVAVGLSGAGANGKNSVGKQTADLIKNRNFPLLVIPSNSKYRKIDISVLACDLRDISDTLPADQITTFINETGSKLLVVNVELGESLGAAGYLKEEMALHKMLDELKPEFHYLNEGNAIKAIIEFAENRNADLIIAVPKTRGFLENLFHESATKKIALNTPLPLLLFHKTPS
ncbi:universal stress protein [Desertivirga xinjiangensis]|uniref:universal stress protein n=1 Tax=Desertivirga xinjiangensis TaxID=539206 RepID=UPI00210CE6B3|nr:universal stress protein [Pedobacter xinjiangensis]